MVSPLPSVYQASSTTTLAAGAEMDKDKASSPAGQTLAGDSTTKLPYVDSTTNTAQQPPSRAFRAAMAAIFVANFSASLEPYMSAVAWPSVMAASSKWSSYRNDYRFHSYNDIGWFALSYYIGSSSFTPLWSWWLKSFSVRSVFPLAMVLLIAGSVISGVISDRTALFVGRAVAGAGASAVGPATVQVLAQLVPQNQRRSYMTVLGGVSSTASIVGPIVAGLLCRNASWRWTLGLHVPFAVVALVLSIFTPVQEASASGDETPTDLCSRISPLKCLTSIFICIQNVTLVLGFGDYEMFFTTSTACIIVMGLAIPWILIYSAYLSDRQAWKLYWNRGSVFMSSMSTCFLSGAWFVIVYFAALRLQGPIPYSSQSTAGLSMLALVVPYVLGSIVSSAVFQSTYRYKNLLLAGSGLACIASGVLFESAKSHRTLTLNYLYFVMAGLGLGLAMRAPTYHTQMDFRYEQELLPAAGSLITFWTDGGRLFGMAIAACIFMAKFQYDAVYRTGSPLTLFPEWPASMARQIIEFIGYSAYPIAISFTGLVFIANLFLPEVRLTESERTELAAQQETAGRAVPRRPNDGYPLAELTGTKIENRDSWSDQASLSGQGPDVPPVYGSDDAQRGLLMRNNASASV